MLTKLTLPQEVEWVLRRLNQAGYEAFLVGGCVRDFLLGKAAHDYDITTNAVPNEIERVFDGRCRILKTGERHGTLTLLVQKQAIEVTTYRIEGAYRDHRSPSAVVFTQELQADLSRRDFTINAMAAHPKLGIIDPFGGQRDLRKGIVRCVGQATARLEEDALRILRAVRFACTLQFRLDSALEDSIRQKAPLLAYISQERIRDEWVRILLSEQPDLLTLLDQINILPYTVPELLVLRDFPQHTPWHLYDVFQHTDIALNHSRGFSLPQKLALLFHDCGKPQTKTCDADGIDHFKGHPAVSAQIAEQALHRLRFDKQTIRAVSLMIQYHDYRILPQEKSLRRFLAKLDFDYDLAKAVLQIQLADNQAKNPKLALPKNEGILQALALLQQMRKCQVRLTRRELAINGNDLKALSLQGKEIGDLLQMLLAHVIEQPQDNQKEILLALARAYQQKKQQK